MVYKYSAVSVLPFYYRIFPEVEVVSKKQSEF